MVSLKLNWIYLMSRIKKSKFNLSHQIKFTCDMGKLYPCFCLDVVPSDRLDLQTQNLVRMAPLLSPIMHNINTEVTYWFVPNRLVWDEWEDFITMGEKYDPEAVAPTFPTITSPTGGWTVGSIQDYFNLPLKVPNVEVSALPFRAYNLVYNEWYRQQDLQDPLPVPTTGGSDATPYAIVQRNWGRDYFTTCLPYPQKGPASLINIGLTGQIPVIGIGTFGTPEYWTPDGQGQQLKMSDGTTINAEGQLQRRTMSFSSNGVAVGSTPADHALLGVMAHPSDIDPRMANVPDIYADLSKAPQNSASVSVNDFRRAYQIQKWMETNARCGSRYVEFIQAHFNIRSPDARLQRPEYIGSARTPIVFSEVLQTSATDTADPKGTPLATMAGHGFSAATTRRMRKTVLEHGYVIGMFSIMPKSTYQQGIPRHFMRNSPFDYLFPEFAHLGEQGVYQGEVYAQGGVLDKDLFGYQARYEEYRRMPSYVCGDFRETLAYWHLGRIFSQPPLLNDSFLKCDPSTRIYAVEAGENNKCLVQFENIVLATRPLPKFAVPALN